jgi:hypothetical protein
LYVPGAALFGTLMVATSGSIDPALTAIGLGGVMVQIVLGGELTVQVELTLPL